jgi:hypothetical protein
LGLFFQDYDLKILSGRGFFINPKIVPCGRFQLIRLVLSNVHKDSRVIMVGQPQVMYRQDKNGDSVECVANDLQLGDRLITMGYGDNHWTVNEITLLSHLQPCYSVSVAPQHHIVVDANILVRAS